MKKRLLAVILMLSLFAAGCGSGASDKEAGKTSGSTQSAEPREHAASSKFYTLDEDGNLSIERPTLIDKSSKENDGTWTIFVYLCGTDLESEAGEATDDLQKMIEAGTDEDIKFIVQTGGTKEWQNDLVDGSILERYKVCDGQIELVDEQPIGNMGDSSSLADFLKWGVTEYPAQNMGLFFWNHGGGTIGGVCCDELYERDSLSLQEIDDALYSINDFMNYNFEFVGFDACLMSTVEMANVLASHAYYMYASEEIVPGSGLDYTAIGSYLMEHPTADGAELGKVLADSYYDLCVSASDDGDTPTMSVIDLSKIDDVVISFNAFSHDIYNALDSDGKMNDVVRSALGTESFGSNNAAVGFTNLVDLGGLVNSLSEYSDKADDVITALKSAVVYAKNGPVHENASGLSVYYPIHVQGSSELKTFRQVAVSPYHLAFANLIAYSVANAGDISAYNDSEIIESWTEVSDASYDYWDYYDESHQTGESKWITFDKEPAVDSNGKYGFTLSEDALNYTLSVDAYVYELSDDYEYMTDLGLNGDVNLDSETGVVTDNFNGNWFSLPDGQKLTVYILSEEDDYSSYTAPIDLNGEETNLVFTHNYTDGSITVSGVWDGVDDTGMSDRMKQLEAGDVITPIYTAYSTETKEGESRRGEAYTYKTDDKLRFEMLRDGDYVYSFVINDLYGDYYTTDVVFFSIANGKVSYNKELN